MKVALFIPCYIDAFFPEVGIATLELLERLGCEVDYPLDQTCCGQPMANSGCHDDAARHRGAVRRRTSPATTTSSRPPGSCAHHVRDQMTAIEQTPAVQAVRRNTYELVEFLHDVLEVREFPWAEFPHKVGLHIGCATLRGAARGQDLRDRRAGLHKPADCCPRSRGLEFVQPQRPDECCGFGGTFSVFEEPVSAKMGHDKVEDHQQAGAEYIVSARHVVRDAPEGLRAARRPAAEVHPHRPDAQRSTRMRVTRIDHAEAASKFIEAKDHADFHDKRLWDLRKKRDSRKRGDAGMGGRCACSPRRSRNTR